MNFYAINFINLKGNLCKGGGSFSRITLANVICVNPVTNFARPRSDPGVQPRTAQYQAFIQAEYAINKILVEIKLAAHLPQTFYLVL